MSASKMYSLYPPQFAPPKESLEFALSDEFYAYSCCVTLYHTGDPDEADFLARHREPVNIGGQSLYDDELLLEHFGYQESGFNTFYNYDNSVLPPQISVVCKTPVLNSKQDVHIINSIGYAFDSEEQPHCIFYNDTIFDTIIQDFTKTFDMVFQAAKDYNLSHIALCYLGGGCFSKHYPSDYLNTLYLPCLQAALAKLDWKPDSIGLMGNVEPRVCKGISNLLHNYDIPFRKLGNVPDILTYPDTLYQNAWDPHSMVGNGNKGDYSLDGFMGRSTLMHFLCWPVTNPNITYKSID